MLIIGMLAFLIVFPWGVEPQSSEPESDILSIELRVHPAALQPYFSNRGKTNPESSGKSKNYL